MQQSCQLLAIGFACAFDRMFLNRYHQHAGWSSLVARWAHNPKVGGSNPPPATKKLLISNAFRCSRKAFLSNLLTICSQNSSRESRIYMILPSVWFVAEGQNNSSSCSTTLRSSSPTKCV